MIVLHGLWACSKLSLWGEDSVALSEASSVPASAGGAGDQLARAHPYAMDVDALRRTVGDLWEGLLASGAPEGEVVVRLPTCDGVPEASPQLGGPPAVGMPAETASQRPLAPWSVPCLVFSPAEAIDLLTALPDDNPGVVGIGASLRYWSRLARMVVDLLAAERFVPDVSQESDGPLRAIWRAVLDAPGVSEWLGACVSAMPPVCRAAAPCAADSPSIAIAEDFLGATVDAMIRRSLTDDPLTHSLGSRPSPAGSLELNWLTALVGNDPYISGSPDERTALTRQVRLWIGQLEEAAGHAHFRTCFKLTAPDAPDDAVTQGQDGDWLVSFHLQAADDPTVMLDAERIWAGGVGLTLLRRQYEMLRGRLEADLRRASHLFEPLAELIDRDPAPVCCRLDTAGAYAFLREAAPLLELNGFSVSLPPWWTSPRSQLGLRLQLEPVASSPGHPARLGLDALVDYRWQAALGDELLSEEEFRRLCRQGQALIRLRGQWIEAIPDATRGAWEFLRRAPEGRATLFEALRFATGDRAPPGLPVIGMDTGGWIAAALDGVGTADQKIADVTQPDAFHGTLRHYQVKGVSWMAFLDRFGLGGCLADDMGLGKTIELIGLLLHERRQGATPGPTLLIVPMSLVGNWQRELARFAPSIRVMVHHGAERLSGEAFAEEVDGHDVIISTYSLTHRDFDHLDLVDWHRVALDEAQNIKNPSAKQTAAIRQLRCRLRLALTGTPLENHLSELWSIMEFLNPGLLGSAGEFRREFAVPIEKHHEPQRADQLRRLIRPFMLRRRKDDPGILDDLPEKMEMKVFCNLSREQAVLYQAVVDDMLGHIELAAGMRRRGLVLSALTRLKQICNHPLSASDHRAGGPQPAEQRARGDLSGRSGKSERLVEMLEEVLAEGERALVFTQFRRMGHLLERQLRERLESGILYLHGGTTAKQRDEMVERFQSDDPAVPVFLLSLKAGGFGLNLTSASHVFHFDRWWNPAVEDQATDRVHRIGQNKRVQVHKFVCVGTLEERIDKMLEEKRDLADRIIGSGERWLTELSTADLREVLTLSQDAVAED
ncbi:MAG: DEAD/DEAH box helicase [Planctomycetota bacterium]|jgi:hypothetical protein